MIERLHLSAILLAAAIVWGALLLLDGVAVSAQWLRPFSAVLGTVVVLLSAFDLFLWRLPFLHGWAVKRPNVRGTWRATVRSTWLDPQTGKPIDPIAGFMVIRQTFSLLSLRLITTESRSEALGAEVLRSEDGTYRIVGVYRNEPRLGVRNRSPIHNGGLLLQVVGAPPSRLDGEYWTDRGTAGELTLADRRKRIADDLESAIDLYRTS